MFCCKPFRCNSCGCGYNSCCSIGPTGPTGPIGAAGELSSAFIFSRIIESTSVEVDNPMPFPITVQSLNITNPNPYTTFTIAETGYYLVNLTFTDSITQLSTVLTDSGGPVVTTYALSAIDETKAITILLQINEINTTLQFLNNLGAGVVTAANLTIVKTAEL